MTLSRICAGDELHSFVLTLFIAFNTPRYGHVIRVSPKDLF